MMCQKIVLGEFVTDGDAEILIQVLDDAMEKIEKQATEPGNAAGITV